jgi:hypothetical protein
MTATTQAIDIHVCCKDTLQNVTITVATADIAEARRIARRWGEQEAGEPVIRTFYKGVVPLPDRATQRVDGVTMWPPLF